LYRIVKLKIPTFQHICGIRIKRALVSVSNKEGIVEFARELQKFGVDILASGGTYKALSDAGLKVKAVSDITKYPEMLGGRLKTLHPAIHGGILAERSDKQHMKELKDLDITPIDMVVSNLYPFEDVAKDVPNNLDNIIENIDIGGPALIRSAAKNYEYVTVVVNPSQYPIVIEELKTKGVISKETRYVLAQEAFRHTSEYDSNIHEFLKSKSGQSFPEILHLKFRKVQELRYGENPHQKAALYKELLSPDADVVNVVKLNGKELSYNNVLDTDAALRIVREFGKPTVTIIKHTNPCSVACGKTLVEAYEKAFSSDNESAFGGIVGLNGNVNVALAEKLSEMFYDIIAAPGYDESALEILKRRKNLIILKLDASDHRNQSMYVTKVDGGVLVQEHDTKGLDNIDVVTKIKPTEEQLETMKFAWKVVKHVKSNAMVVAKDEQTFGIGIGQTSRVNAVKIALDKAGENSRNAVLASDGFFPFRDSIDLAAKYGISAIIQPGGSIKDKEVIQAADEHSISMAFTGIRAFKH